MKKLTLSILVFSFLISAHAENSIISAQCASKLFQAAGWKTQIFNNTDTIHYNDGNPCDNENLQESWDEGELQIQFPNQKIELSDKLMELLGSMTSRCGYKQKLKEATLNAAIKLAKNPYYRFTDGNAFVELPRSEWKCVGGSCYAPRNSCSDAMDCLYTGSCKTECAVGLQVMGFAAQYEFLGEKAFNSLFKKNLIVGPWSQLKQFEGHEIFQENKGSYEDSNLSKLASYGAAAWNGMGGAIHNLRGEDYLDSPADRNENFMIVHASQAAGKELAEQGSLDEINDIALEAWKFSSLLRAEVRNKLFQPEIFWGKDYEYVFEEDFLSDLIGEQSAYVVLKIRELLSNDFLRGTLVYVHPLGIKSFSWHLTRLLRINSRTAYAIQLYPDQQLTTWFANWINYQFTTIPECQ